MSTVILLSSSPPRTFARSPTPANSSSPLPSTAALLQGDSPGRKKFKTHADKRDGFPAVFSTARQVLAEKSGAENKKLGSPARYKFRSSQDNCTEELLGKQDARNDAPATAAVETDIPGPEPHVPKQVKSKQALSSKKLKVQVQKSERQNEEYSEQLIVQRAVARKTDWTPPKPQVRRDDDERPTEYSAGFMNGMLSSFTYPEISAVDKAPRVSEGGNPAKRRRVDSLTKGSMGTKALSAPNIVRTNSAPGKPTPKRNRSPSKKALTITGLATSNYFGPEETTETPLMQYLTSTQAQMHDTVIEAGLETKVRKSQDAIKKLKGAKKNQPKSLLLSPTSAMKTYESQEAIFGSASQLARDESPTFIRDTIEAMKESESFLLSDPICSPQRTQLASVENTPRTGTSRFRRTRNLWSAAGRDEDNALLHVDTVDLSDSPAIRAAFAGKDALVQPNSRPSVLLGNCGMSLRGGGSPLSPYNEVALARIGDVTTLCGAPARSFSTSTRQASPRKSPMRSPPEQITAASEEKGGSTVQKDQPPPKPNYAGFSTQDLNKQIKSFGFKAMRKREKMIELLDRCWEEKHGPSEDIIEKEPEEVAPFGDFLSKVHDLSARPEPKTKKPRVRKKKEQSESEPKDKPAKKSRKAQKVESTTGLGEGEQEKPKATRKRKPKAKSTGKESILDIDSVLDTIPEELRTLEAFDDWAKPERKLKTKVKAQPTPIVVEPQVPPTPSTPIIPRISTSAELAPLENTGKDTEPTPSQTEPKSKPDPVISSASPSSHIIASAILHQSQSTNPARNHNTHPTWHEKILLYDPIILEDLAAWLNTEGLGAIGEDKEVSALEVREWCESQGICCLWRGGWRGNKGAQ